MATAQRSRKVVPSSDVVARTARYFQVSTDFLLFDDREQEERVRDREMLDYLVKADKLHHAHKSIVKEIIDSLLVKESVDQQATAKENAAWTVDPPPRRA